MMTYKNHFPTLKQAEKLKDDVVNKRGEFRKVEVIGEIDMRPSLGGYTFVEFKYKVRTTL